MKEARRSAEVDYSAHSLALHGQGGWQGWRGFVLARKEVDTRCKALHSSLLPTSLHSSFYLAPADGGAVAAHAGGQYLTMRLDLPGSAHPVVRSYTITGGGEGQVGGWEANPQYRVTVKREEKGLVSSFLHTELQVPPAPSARLQPGDGLELSAPAGDFTLSPAPLPRVTALLCSLLRCLSAQEPASHRCWP